MFIRSTIFLATFGTKFHLKPICNFEENQTQTYFNDLLTYLETIRAKVVMFGIKPKLMKCRVVLTYFYEILTYLKTIRAKVVMFGIKLKLM
jgi:hypothetical protein